jgi:hypothetical protein
MSIQVVFMSVRCAAFLEVFGINLMAVMAPTIVGVGCAFAYVM